MSITHGSSPRKHIWTYAIGLEDDGGGGTNNCPCNTGGLISADIPYYVGNNHYCESGTDSPSTSVFYSNDTLWDGMDCNNDETQCCTNSNQPWFNTTLSETTNDDLELRLMFLSTRNNVGGPLDLIELYIR